MARNEAHKRYLEIFHNAWRMSYGDSPIPPCGSQYMKKKNKEVSGGAVLDSFRSGTRAEYLARYAFSRFCFVNQVPRQEDFGIADFFCTLGKRREVIKENKKYYLVYPENSFYVQVKANRETYELNSRVIEWLSGHISNPFFICIINQSTDMVSFYTPTLIWAAVAIKPKSAGVKFFFDKARFEAESVRSVRYNEYMAMVGKGERAKFNIYLGDPIFEKTVSFLEKDDKEEAYKTLKPHIISEFKNIWTSRLIGPTISTHLIDNKEFRGVYRTSEYGKIEESVKGALLALLHNYTHNGQSEKMLSLAMYLTTIGVDAKTALQELNYGDEAVSP